MAYPHTHAEPALAAAASAATVRALNDTFRRTFVGGQVVETPGAVDLREADRIALLLAVRRFDRFDADNNPHSEHDFGTVEVGGQRFFWKIDCYDSAMLGHSPDLADSSVTTRVLTIMCADEC
ncbi:DUF3768 domain-containing protein [Methylobacterium sp. WL30]|uniref:DUF3768 domain-containing protein n=1 Tax=unclassified Methylobacterium TaxID=2615210 RepID=UPI0011CA2BE8|nr:MULTISPECIES: DUF3768 domain-containing protein [unclassified Methylobacterium]TXN40818.1 DUF3768 domain-containing protein [Methylobacterium sp. WL93]TXN50726.1 DUF3768 domain-containing protein [Methylobacterium sp. WL119]TXN62961.1 DUF3768 domain-containing protein [Methylobacterium sp. WL30]